MRDFALSLLPATVLTNSHQICRSGERIRDPEASPGRCGMTIRNVVVPLEIEYLQEAAKKRGISRTRLVQVVMEKVVKDELVLAILNDDDQPRNELRQPRYRRFREGNAN
jgi:hypothetical protein